MPGMKVRDWCSRTNYLRHPMGLYPFVFDGFFTATLQDELNICLVRIDTHKLNRQWYLDPARFEIEWTTEDGYWSHHNLHQYVCVKGSIPPDVMDFYTYALERDKPELRVVMNDGVAHVVARIRPGIYKYRWLHTVLEKIE